MTRDHHLAVTQARQSNQWRHVAGNTMDVGIADTNAVVDLAWRGIHASAGHSRRDRPEREPVLACTLGATRRGLLRTVGHQRVQRHAVGVVTDRESAMKNRSDAGVVSADGLWGW